MIFFSQYKHFKKVYPKDIQIATLFFVIQMARKTILNTWSGILMIPCIFLSLYILYKNKSIISKAVKGTQAMIWYAVFAGLSFLWAIEKDPTSIFLKDIEIVCSYMAIAVVIYKIKEVAIAYNYIIILCSLTCALGIIRGFIVGTGLHTNSYSVAAYVGTILSYCAFKNFGAKSALFYFFFNLLALLVGTSSASYISFIIALSVLFTSSYKGIRLGKTFSVLIVCGLIYYFVGDYIKELVFFNKSEEAIKTGTGRAQIWSVFIEAWTKQPWFGYGFFVGERSFSFFSGQEISYMSAHNGYLSLLVNTGVLGLLLYSPLFIKSLWRGFVNSNKGLYGMLSSAMFACLIGVLVNNYAYPILGSDWNYAFPPIIALIVLLNTFDRKKQSQIIKTVF